MGLTAASHVFGSVDARRREVVAWFIGTARATSPRRLLRRQRDWRPLLDPPARIAGKGGDVRHLARERVGA